jgi:hypothetical protein
MRISGSRAGCGRLPKRVTLRPFVGLAHVHQQRALRRGACASCVTSPPVLTCDKLAERRHATLELHPSERRELVSRPSILSRTSAGPSASTVFKP